MQLKNTLLMIADRHKTTLIQYDGTSISLDKKAKQILYDACLMYGTTLSGTVEAIKHHLHIRQKCPVCISIRHQLVFFPLPSSKTPQEMWIRYVPNMHIRILSDHQTLIEIHDRLKIQVGLNHRIIKRQLHRCRTYIDKLHAIDVEYPCFSTTLNMVDIDTFIEQVGHIH